MPNDILKLVNSYHAEPTLCVVGEKLPKGKWLWKMYIFLVQFADPSLRINDTATDAVVEYTCKTMYWDINEKLKPYHLSLHLIGGNLYLAKVDKPGPF